MFLQILVTFSCLSLISGIPTCKEDKKYTPVPWNSRLYFNCHGRNFKQCNEGQYFNDSIAQCVFGKAELKPTTNEARLINQPDLGVEDSSEVSTNIKMYNLSERLRNNISKQCRENSITPVTCPEEELVDSLLPHPDDCQLFYYCVRPDLPPICRDCPAGLHFNPVKHVCDDPENAGCSAGLRATDARPT